MLFLRQDLMFVKPLELVSTLLSFVSILEPYLFLSVHEVATFEDP